MRRVVRWCLLLGHLLFAHLAGAQPQWIRHFQQRTACYTAQQPRWAGPVFTTVPMLVQVLREDAAHQESAGTLGWNVGVSKGLQVVPLPRLEFTATVPPYFLRPQDAGDGFGDFFSSVKVRIAAQPETRGNYILAALLNSTVPTGSYRNGAPDATMAPQLVGGKGWGRFDQVLSLSATLPVQHTRQNGRVLVANTASQFHALRYLWPAVETSTTAWLGGARDGQVQTLLGPSVIVGRVPYTRHERDRRRGVSVGAGYLTAVTHTHSTNHLLQVTLRLHF